MFSVFFPLCLRIHTSHVPVLCAAFHRCWHVVQQTLEVPAASNKWYMHTSVHNDARGHISCVFGTDVPFTILFCKHGCLQSLFAAISTHALLV